MLNHFTIPLATSEISSRPKTIRPTRFADAAERPLRRLTVKVFTFKFSDSTVSGINRAGTVNARAVMTGKIIVVEFVLPTALAIGLGFLLSIGTNYLTERYLGPVIDLLT